MKFEFTQNGKKRIVYQKHYWIITSENDIVNEKFRTKRDAKHHLSFYTEKEKKGYYIEKVME